MARTKEELAAYAANRYRTIPRIREMQTAYAKSHRAEINARFRKRWKEDQEFRLKRISRKKDWDNKNRDHRKLYRWRKLLSRYGVDEKWYWKVFQDQLGVCVLCGLPETRKAHGKGKSDKLCVDHDHKTGRARGLLCSVCNFALHRAEKNRQWLVSAIGYLKKYD